MKVGERIIVGEIKERAEAKKIYNKATADAIVAKDILYIPSQDGTLYVFK